METFINKKGLRKELCSIREELILRKQFINSHDCMDEIGFLEMHRRKVKKKGERFDYFHVVKKTDGRYRRYLKREDPRIKLLAQKSYNQRELILLEKQIKDIEAVLSSDLFLPESFEYDKLPKERQSLVVPIVCPDDEYRDRWETVEYPTMNEHKEALMFETKKGHMVRSKSELMIANELYDAGLPYRYEAPVDVRGRKVFVDFTILDMRSRKEVLWEHFGRMDDPDYVMTTLKKLNGFEQVGMRLGTDFICTFETQGMPLDPRVIRRKISLYFKD